MGWAVTNDNGLGLRSRFVGGRTKNFGLDSKLAE